MGKLHVLYRVNGSHWHVYPLEWEVVSKGLMVVVWGLIVAELCTGLIHPLTTWHCNNINPQEISTNEFVCLHLGISHAQSLTIICNPSTAFFQLQLCISIPCSTATPTFCWCNWCAKVLLLCCNWCTTNFTKLKLDQN